MGIDCPLVDMGSIKCLEEFLSGLGSPTRDHFLLATLGRLAAESTGLKQLSPRSKPFLRTSLL